MDKPPFDPSKPFEAAAKPAFDPSKPFAPAMDTSPLPRQQLTPLESALTGAEQGASLGFYDEGKGALLGAIGKLRGEGNYSDLYKKYRDVQREYTRQAASDNPVAYGAGNLAGSVAGLAVPGIAELSIPGKIGVTALKGAALGGVTGAGVSEANPFESPEKASEFGADVGVGAALGGTLSAAGQKLGEAIQGLTPASLREYANRRALSAAGFMSKDLKDISPVQQQEIGRNLIDNKVVTALSSLKDVSERAAAGKQEAGKAIGAALKSVDDHVQSIFSRIDSGDILAAASDEQKKAAKNYIADNFQFNMKNIGERINDEIINPNADNPVLKNELSKLASLSADFASKPAQSLASGNQIKSSQGMVTRFNSDTVPDIFKSRVYGIIKDELENAVARTGNAEYGANIFQNINKNAITSPNANELTNIAAKNQDALANYQENKNLYGSMLRAQKAADSRLGTTNANRTFGLTDYLAGAAGASVGGGPTAIAAGVLNKIARKYGASVQAVGADKLANGIEAVLTQSPEILKKFGPVIEQAAKKGNKSLVAVHFALMKDPQYSSIMSQERSN